MLDIVFVAAMAAFFAVAVLFVKACEKIIGPDIEGERLDTAPDSAGATTAERAA